MIECSHLSKLDDESANATRTDTFFLDDKISISIVGFIISVNDWIKYCANASYFKPYNSIIPLQRNNFVGRNIA